MLEAARPKFFVPIHGEYRHLVHHAKLARETGVKDENVTIAVSGDVLELTPDSLRIIDHLDDTRVLIEGREGNDISRMVLKDRKQMGETGVVFLLMVRDPESRRILSAPEVIFKGLVHEQDESFFLGESKKLVKKLVNQYHAEVAKGGPVMDLQEEARVGLRRYFNAELGKKPVVLPIILDV